MTTRFADHLLTGLLVDRPAAAAVPAGTLYSSTDDATVYQSDGTDWSAWSAGGGGGAAVYTDTGTPDSGDGAEGDLYLDQATNFLYQKRVVGGTPAFRSTSSVTTLSTATSHVCSLPAGYAAGDLLIMAAHWWGGGSTSAVPAPSGWTRQADYMTGAVSDYFAVYTRVADGTEGSNVTLTSSTDQSGNIVILAYSGSAGMDAIADQGSYQTGTTPTVPSVTTTVADDIVVGLTLVDALNSTGNATPPGGWTERADHWSDQTFSIVQAMEKAQATAGASPTATPTLNVSGGHTRTYAVAVKAGTATAAWTHITLA